MAFPLANRLHPGDGRIRIEYEKRHWDKDGYERTERRNGASQCPKCGLWWPVIEEPDCWTEHEVKSNRWDATGWWGAACCEICELLMIEQPDGIAEVYNLAKSQ